MRDRLFRPISIRTAEESGLIILFCQSLFLGIFFGTFDISAHSLFLSLFDESMMARAYILSGLAGIILTLIFSRYYTRILYRNLAVANLIFITAVTLLLWILLLLNPAGWVLFLVFIALGPLNILAMLGFSGTLNSAVTFRSMRNIPGILEGGLIAGIILSCYSIPVLLTLNFTPQNILGVSAAAVSACTVIQVIAGKRKLFNPGENHRLQIAAESTKPLQFIFRADPFIRILATFAALSVMTAFFIQYSFMAVTRVQYPAAGEMARFLGLFTGSVMVFTLIFKFLVFPYFMRNLSLRTCLIVTPFLIAIITIIAVAIGFSMGYTPAAAGFMIFFMLLALNRLFSRSLKESVEAPSVMVVSRIIDEKYSYMEESGMAGTINEIAAVISGLVLTGLGILSSVELVHFSLVLIVIAFLWVVAAFQLYSEYRDSVRKISNTTGQGLPQESSQPALKEMKNRLSAEITFADDYFNLITGDLRYLESNDNKWFFNKILDQADIMQDINLLPALKKIRTTEGIEKEIRQRSAEIITTLDAILSGEHEKHDRTVNAMVMLSDSRPPQTAEVLKLLRDKNTDLRKIALNMIRKFRITEMLPEVCECIGNSALEAQAANVLKDFGGEADEVLRRFYFRSSGNISISKTILSLLGKAGNRENEEFLFSLFWSGPRQTREAALKSLAGLNYKIRENDKERLLRLISDVTGIIAWNLSARITIKRKKDPLLLEAINKDINRWNSFLFNLLTITYGAGFVKSIRENISSRKPESVSHALEIIDIVADESVKPKLRLLFDTISDLRKVKILHRFFPGEINDYEKLVEDIINRDYSSLGVWIRACVIRNLPQLNNGDLAQSVIALLFSPEIILREETVKLLSRSGKDFYNAASDRIPLEARNRLESIISGTISERDLLYEKVKFLESLFHGLPEENLFVLATELKHAEKLSPELLPVQRSFILWQGDNSSQGFRANIYYENILDDNTGQDSNAFGYILPLQAVEEYHYKFPEHSLEIIKYIDEIE